LEVSLTVLLSTELSLSEELLVLSGDVSHSFLQLGVAKQASPARLACYKTGRAGSACQSHTVPKHWLGPYFASPHGLRVGPPACQHKKKKQNKKLETNFFLACFLFFFGLLIVFFIKLDL
jgi:hypothetical protein